MLGKNRVEMNGKMLIMVMVVKIINSVRFHILVLSMAHGLEIGEKFEIIFNQRDFGRRDPVFNQAGCIFTECRNQFLSGYRRSGEALAIKGKRLFTVSETEIDMTGVHQVVDRRIAVETQDLCIEFEGLLWLSE